jgi:hypothetical protein
MPVIRSPPVIPWVSSRSRGLRTVGADVADGFVGADGDALQRIAYGWAKASATEDSLSILVRSSTRGEVSVISNGYPAPKATASRDSPWWCDPMTSAVAIAATKMSGP